MVESFADLPDALAVEGTAKEASIRYGSTVCPHSKNATNALRGLMITMELELAHEAPHNLIFLDGSFVVLLNYMNQRLTSFYEAPSLLRDEFEFRPTGPFPVPACDGWPAASATGSGLLVAA